MTSPRTLKTTSLTRIYSNCLLDPGVVLQFQVSQSTGQDLVAFQVHPADLPRRFQQSFKFDRPSSLTQQQKLPGHKFTLGTGSSFLLFLRAAPAVRKEWNPFKVRCQDLANRKQDKSHFYFNLAERAAPHNVQSLAKRKVKVQNTEFLRQRFCGENSYVLLISLHSSRPNCKMWHRQSTTEILKRKENFKRSDIKNKIYKKKKTASASQL